MLVSRYWIMNWNHLYFNQHQVSSIQYFAAYGSNLGILILEFVLFMSKFFHPATKTLRHEEKNKK